MTPNQSEQSTLHSLDKDLSDSEQEGRKTYVPPTLRRLDTMTVLTKGGGTCLPADNPLSGGTCPSA